MRQRERRKAIRALARNFTDEQIKNAYEWTAAEMPLFYGHSLVRCEWSRPGSGDP